MPVIGKTDEDLMKVVKQGDLDALVPLFDKYNIRLFNFFLRLTHNRETAEDLTQNVFSRIISYRHTYKEEYKFKTWIYQMARNVHIDNYQKNRLDYSADKDVERLGEKAGDAQAEFDREQRHKILHDALQVLPDEDREIIELSRFQDLQYNEIARITGNSEGAVRVKIHRAIKKLREIYFQIA